MQNTADLLAPDGSKGRGVDVLLPVLICGKVSTLQMDCLHPGRPLELIAGNTRMRVDKLWNILVTLLLDHQTSWVGK